MRLKTLSSENGEEGGAAREWAHREGCFLQEARSETSGMQQKKKGRGKKSGHTTGVRNGK